MYIFYLQVFTLNCWGLKFVSKLRKERFAAIADYLSEHPGSGYDVVFLQVIFFIFFVLSIVNERVRRSQDEK